MSDHQGCELRLLEPQDIPAALKLWSKTEGVGLDHLSDSPGALSRFMERNPGLSFVAVDKTQVVGTVLCGHDGRRAYLYHLAVEDSHRGRGIGRALVQKCVQTLEGQGIPRCSIHVFRSNRKGLEFWEHLGWKSRDDLAVVQVLTKSLV